jgi:hypothetical protein
MLEKQLNDEQARKEKKESDVYDQIPDNVPINEVKRITSNW